MGGTIDNQEAQRLRRFLERDNVQAWEIAHYQRSRQDEATIKIRFALAALNGASAVAAISLLGRAEVFALQHDAVLWSLAGYIAGLVLAALALLSQEIRLIRLTGHAVTRARSLDSCVSLLDGDLTWDRQKPLDEALSTAHQNERDMTKSEGWGYWFAAGAGAFWLSTSVGLLIAAARSA